MKSKPKSSLKGSPLYLCSPVNALVEGLYEEKVPLREIKQHGDFGLGTFDNLDGEMIMLDGTVYQINSAGRVAVINDECRTPFACVTFYRPISHEEVAQEMDYPAFLDLVQRLLPSPNIFYAIRMEGVFAYVKTRSVPKQANYRPLVDVAKDQPEFEFRNISGTLAGFITPSFMGSVNVPGLHLHFLSTDLTCGGHLLECRPRQGRIGVQFITRLELSFPMTFDYLTQDFTRNIEKDLNKAEK
ncbi:MAG: acetolactate decarboxylase [Kiritimatiellae bacterium]|nr:acetolactate decarboxylase [Kiritimatiellia bacterium]